MSHSWVKVTDKLTDRGNRAEFIGPSSRTVGPVDPSKPWITRQGVSDVELCPLCGNDKTVTISQNMT